MARSKIYKWFEGTSVDCWFENHIGYRITNLRAWWYQEHTEYYLERATEKIIVANYEVLPEATKVYSWRRFWIPIKCKVTIVPAFNLTWAVAIDQLKENNDYRIIQCGISGGWLCSWVYLFRNGNIYVIEKASDIELGEKYAYPTKEELAEQKRRGTDNAYMHGFKAHYNESA